MAKQVLTNVKTLVGNVDLSDHISSVTIEDSADEVEFTAFSSSAYKEFGQGLKDATITLAAFQDYAGSSVDATFQPFYVSGGTVEVQIIPVNTTVSATNPRYTMSSRVYSYSPVSGQVGEANSIDITLRNAGTAGLVRGTT